VPNAVGYVYREKKCCYEEKRGMLGKKLHAGKKEKRKKEYKRGWVVPVTNLSANVLQYPRRN